MKVVFFSNYLNHHQVGIADEFYKVLGDDYCFVGSTKPSAVDLKGGEDYSCRPYFLCASASTLNQEKALDFALTADVALFDGFEFFEYQIERAKLNLLTFEVGERWLKRGVLNILSPRLLKNMWYYHTLFYKTPTYKLCASAFAASDQRKLFSYKNKCYKWGYFPEVLKSGLKENSDSRVLRLMWCSRLIDWKHPELAIQCAKHLKYNNYNFVLDMFGDGEMRDDIERLIAQYQIDEVVTLHGNVSNEQIHNMMLMSDIFLFTSDKREGWGVVANEAMSAGCCVVGSNEIGSIPYLIKDNENGLIFESCNLESLCQKVKYLLDNSDKRKLMSQKATSDMINLWSPKNAVKSFLQLIMDLKEKGETSITVGPCSKA